VNPLGTVVVNSASRVIVAEGRRVAAVEGLERIELLHRVERVLLDALETAKEEQLVADERSTEAPAELIALEGKVGSAGTCRRTRPLIAEQTERLSMERIDTGPRAHRHRTRAR
jgi:hypothetical protein